MIRARIRPRAQRRRSEPSGSLRRLRLRLRTRCSDDTGSITPLAIGFTAIALALIFLAVVISDIYLAQRKLYALADSAALSAADSFDPSYRGTGPHIEFTDAEVHARATSYLAEVPRSERFHRIRSQGRARDDATVEVTIRAHFQPLALSPFVPNGIPLEATAVSRGGLRLGR